MKTLLLLFFKFHKILSFSYYSVIQISGEFSKVKDAVYNVTGRLRDNLFSSTLNTAGTRSSSSVLTETSPYGKLRDPAPLGVHSSVAVSHGFSRPTLTQGMDLLGLSHSLDRPPSPRSWSAQVGSLSVSLSSVSLSHITELTNLLPFMGGFDCSQ